MDLHNPGAQQQIEHGIILRLKDWQGVLHAKDIFMEFIATDFYHHQNNNVVCCLLIVLTNVNIYEHDAFHFRNIDENIKQ